MKTAIIVILVFSLLIFTHEMGHFIAAKLCGVKVNRFALGMGPALFKFKKGETEYSLRIFPIGGFCEMEGENGDIESKANEDSEQDYEDYEDRDYSDYEFETWDEEETNQEQQYVAYEKSDFENQEHINHQKYQDGYECQNGINDEKYVEGEYEIGEGEVAAEPNPRAFCNKKAWQKILILFAGPFMNGITAFILVAILLCNIGVATTTIDQVSQDAPAYSSGLQAGDKILYVDTTKINKWEDVGKAIEKSEDNNVKIVVLRDGKEVTIATDLVEAEDGSRYIGITAQRGTNILGSIAMAPKYTMNLTVKLLDVFKQLFTGKVSTKEMSGPVGIVYIVNKTTEQGWMNLIYLVALLSLNLAIFNLLPFPALDGGRIVFVIIRKLTGKLISDKTEAIVNFAGIIVLFGFMIYVTWNDVVRFIAPLF